MFAGEVIGQAVTRHSRGPVESGICFGNPPHVSKLKGLAVRPVKNKKMLLSQSSNTEPDRVKQQVLPVIFAHYNF